MKKAQSQVQNKREEKIDLNSITLKQAQVSIFRAEVSYQDAQKLMQKFKDKSEVLFEASYKGRIQEMQVLEKIKFCLRHLSKTYKSQQDNVQQSFKTYDEYMKIISERSPNIFKYIKVMRHKINKQIGSETTFDSREQIESENNISIDFNLNSTKTFKIVPKSNTNEINTTIAFDKKKSTQAQMRNLQQIQDFENLIRCLSKAQFQEGRLYLIGLSENFKQEIQQNIDTFQKKYLKLMKDSNQLFQKHLNEHNFSKQTVMDIAKKLSLMVATEKFYDQNQQKFNELKVSIEKRIDSLKKIEFEKKSNDRVLAHLKKYEKQYCIQINNFEDINQLIELLEIKLKNTQGMINKILMPDSNIIHPLQIQRKQFLIDSLRKTCNLRTLFFKLLYTYDRRIKSNFHEYIDQKQRILLIIQLQNNQIIGGFTVNAFESNCGDSTGFLFNLNKKCIYEHIKKQAIKYDDSRLIFGNSEIRLEYGEQVIYSNFGLNNNNFDSKGQTVNQFLNNNGIRTANILKYEIYQVVCDFE